MGFMSCTGPPSEVDMGAANFVIPKSGSYDFL